MNPKKYLSAVCTAMLLAAPLVLHADDRDSQIAKDARHNLPSNLSSDVSISCQDRVVTVKGTVDSDSQRRVVIAAIKQVPDVQNIDDEMQVRDDANAQANDQADHHSDKWIAFKVKSELAFHSNVSATHTDVSVMDGVVTLTGWAKDEAQKQLTAEYARRVDGVRDVRNLLQVRGDETAVGMNGNANNNATFQGDTYNRPDDGTITAKVKLALAKNSGTSAIRTHVRTQNGVVYISGDAKNPSEKDLVSQLAKDVPGVASVENDMTVDNQNP